MGSVTIRLPEADKLRLKSDADLAGLSVSEIVRRNYFGLPIIANADATMIKELRRMGGLMKHLHQESNGAYRQQTSDAIASIVQYIDILSAKN